MGLGDISGKSYTELKAMRDNLKEVTKQFAVSRKQWKGDRNAAQKTGATNLVSKWQLMLNKNLPQLKEAEENKKVIVAQMKHLSRIWYAKQTELYQKAKADVDAGKTAEVESLTQTVYV